MQFYTISEHLGDSTSAPIVQLNVGKFRFIYT